ncbi:MAG: 2-aminobenzoate-CoA ligase [Xanthobacteraceae bacterium]|nr:MAG: 2-aminobenzoate-CoA ligase [Xanthobacteraceae bacterium]
MSNSNRSGHRDSFATDNLPPRESWPDLLLNRPEFAYPPRLNVVVELIDKAVAAGHGARPCVFAPGIAWSYADFLDRVNRIASVLVRKFGLVPGNRVLLRAANNPMMLAAYFAVLKAGGVAVATMPLMRAGELATVINKAQVSLAVCDHRIVDELRQAREQAAPLKAIVTFGGGTPDDLESLTAGTSPDFAAADTAQDDVCLIAFTSGTTGVPKGTMHFHRDLLAICDSYSRHLLQPRSDDRFIGSPPLAFTFGLGGLALFPLRAGASTVLLEKTTPQDLLDGIETFKATVIFTAPTAYRAMLAELPRHDIASLRRCVSAGETLPAPTFEVWRKATGLTITEGIGSTEMLHIFIGCTPDSARPGVTGQAVPGYEARIVDDEGRPVPDGTPGRLAVRGPTGCRYLADPRQKDYVQHGWNITGDVFVRDADGYFRFEARGDDMIISSGYNIAGPEVEAALLRHPAVADCGVVAAPDEERGQIVKAYVVLAPGQTPGPDLARALQEHVKASIAPYKYPRQIEFVADLPRTATGKVQRFVLRKRAKGEG